MMSTFSLLEPDGDPTAGLFFIDPLTLGGPNDLCAGITFLVGRDGLLVTCAHVAVAMDRVPGEIVVVRAMSPHMPVMFEAEVLARNWLGPDWKARSESLDRRQRNWLNECDARPDVFREDHVLLQLLSGTVRWDDRGGMTTSGSAEAHLKSGARVLPLAPPGYGRSARPRFQQWRVVYEQGAPKVETAYSEFQGVEPSLRSLIQVRSTELAAGYSGSPIWDPDRKRVVGMVRRGMRHSGATVLGVDARKLAHLAGVPLVADAAASSFIHLARKNAEALSPLRHFPLLGSFVPRELLRLRVRPAESRDPLSTAPPTEPADVIDALMAGIAERDAKAMVVRGGAGAGKSTMMFQLALELLTNPVVVDGLLAVPFPVSAADLRFYDYDVMQLIAAACRSFATTSRGDKLDEDCIALNDLCIVLLVDGIDEIETNERGRLLARLSAFCSSHSSYRVIATTRPFEDRDLSSNQRAAERMCYMDLVALGDSDVDAFATAMYADPDERLRFRQALGEIEWDRTGPLPLQLAMASRAFAAGELDGRPIDMLFGLVRHLLELGIAEDMRLRNGPAGASDSVRMRHVERFELIMQRIASCYMHGATTRDEVAMALQDDPRTADDIGDADEVMVFVEREASLRGALLNFVAQEGSANRTLVWPHRTVPETLAARDVAWRKSHHGHAAVQEIFAMSREHGQSFGVIILAALDRTEGGRLSVDQFLTQCLDRGAIDYNATIFAMRALGAGIVVGEEVGTRLAKTLVTLLLLPPHTRLGRIKCSEVYTMPDLPDVAELANRPRIRPLVSRQLHVRLGNRDLRKRGVDAPIRISAREAQLLDRLGMWHEMELPLAAAEQVQSTGQPAARAVRTSMRGSNLADSATAALLLAEILARLRDRADDFMTGFAAHVRNAPPDVDPIVLAHSYLALLDRGSRPPEP